MDNFFNSFIFRINRTRICNNLLANKLFAATTLNWIHQDIIVCRMWGTAKLPAFLIVIYDGLGEIYSLPTHLLFGRRRR